MRYECMLDRRLIALNKYCGEVNVTFGNGKMRKDTWVTSCEQLSTTVAFYYWLST